MISVIYRPPCLCCKRKIKRGKGCWKPKMLDPSFIQQNGFILPYLQHKQLRFELDVDSICRKCFQKARAYSATMEQNKAEQDRKNPKRDDINDPEDNVAITGPDNNIGIKSKKLLNVIKIPGYVRVEVNGGACITRISGCTNFDVHKIPLDIRLDMLLKQNIFIDETVHICTGHDQANVWPNITKLIGKFHKTFNSMQLAEMIDMLKKASNRGLSFKITEDEDMYQYYTGFNKTELLMILAKTPSLRWKFKRPLNSLSMVLSRFHRKDSLELLYRLFLVNRKTLVYNMKVKKCLAKEFIPHDLGYHPKTTSLNKAMQKILNRKMKYLI